MLAIRPRPSGEANVTESRNVSLPSSGSPFVRAGQGDRIESAYGRQVSVLDSILVPGDRCRRSRDSGRACRSGDLDVDGDELPERGFRHGGGPGGVPDDRQRPHLLDRDRHGALSASVLCRSARGPHLALHHGTTGGGDGRIPGLP